MATSKWVAANANFWSHPELQALPVSSNLYQDFEGNWMLKRDYSWINIAESLGIQIDFDDYVIQITLFDVDGISNATSTIEFSWHQFKDYFATMLQLVGLVQDYFFYDLHKKISYERINHFEEREYLEG
jgi:hypothetical protein